MAEQNEEQGKRAVNQSGEGAVATGGGVAAGSGGAAIGGNVGGDVIVNSTVTKKYLPAERVVGALHQLPAPPADFTGREKELKEILEGIHQGATISGIRGMGGVGKTALALVLADQLQRDYPDGQFFLNLKGAHEDAPLTAQDAMRHVILSMEPTTNLPEEEQRIAGMYHSLLHEKRVLLLWDNARDGEQVAPLLTAGCLTLVTSRQHFVLPGLLAIDLDALTQEDARALVLSIAAHVPREEASEIARLGGYLPLAVRLAASALAERKDLKPAEYLKRLEESHVRLGLVDRSLALSYDLLSEELKLRFRKLGIFPAPFGEEAAAAVWDTEVERGREVLGQLLRYSVIQYDQHTELYELHDLVRLFANSRLDQDENLSLRVSQIHANYYLRAALECNTAFVEGGADAISAVNRFREVWPQLGVAWERVAAWPPEKVSDSPHLERWLTSFVSLSAGVLDLQLTPSLKIPLLDRALEAARKLGDLAVEANALGQLGIAHRQLGRAEAAIEFHTRALAIWQEMGNRNGEADAQGNLAMVYGVLRESTKTIELAEQALMIDRETGDRHAEAGHLGTLGIAYGQLGDNHKAIDIFERALPIHKETGNRRGEGQTLGNLGIAYDQLGNTTKAVECFEQDLEIVKEIGDRRGEGAALLGLGTIHDNRGEIQEAIDCYEKALAIQRHLGDRRGEADVLANLASVHMRLGETRRAIEDYHNELAIAQEMADPVSQVRALDGLGNAYFALREADQAALYHERQLRIARETANRRGQARALVGLGNAELASGNAPGAIEYFEQMLTIVPETGDRAAEGAALAGLVAAHVRAGEPQKAIVLSEKSLAVLREVGDRRGEGFVFSSLGLAHANPTEADVAIAFFEQALIISRETGDREAEANNLGNLGQTYFNVAARWKAASSYGRALAIYRDIGNRPQEAQMLGKMGIAYASMGILRVAIAFYETLVPLADELGDQLGRAAALANMANWCYGIGERPRAILLMREALKIFEAIEAPDAGQAQQQLDWWVGEE